jgi:hypothetical protein
MTYVVSRKMMSEAERAHGRLNNVRTNVVVRVNDPNIARTIGAGELGVPEDEVEVTPYPEQTI